MKTAELLEIVKRAQRDTRQFQQLRHLPDEMSAINLNVENAVNVDGMGTNVTAVTSKETVIINDGTPNLAGLPSFFDILDIGAIPQELDPPPLIIDFETFFSRKFSLSRMNYLEYILSSKFKIHGIAIRYPDGRMEFRTDAETAIRGFQKCYGKNLERVVVVGHNFAFDGLILKLVFGIVPVQLVDTMLLARLLHGPDESASLAALAERYGLKAKGDLTFMEG